MKFDVGPEKDSMKAEVQSLLDLEFSHVLPGHGNAVIGQAKEKYRPVLDGELKGCHGG